MSAPHKEREDARAWVRLSLQAPGETSETAVWVTAVPVDGSLRNALDEVVARFTQTLADHGAKSWIDRRASEIDGGSR